MYYSKLLYMAIGIGTSIIALSAQNGRADYIINDDLSVIEGGCVGQDCHNGETFDEALKIKENNTRIGFVNSATTDDPWRMTANDSRNGGQSYMAFEQYQFPPVVSDGSIYYYYDSSGNYHYNPADYDPDFVPPFPNWIGTPIPEGEILYEILYNAGLEPAHIGEGDGNFKVGASSNGGVALGKGSSLKEGTVSVGGTGTERRITHVEDAIYATDAVNLSQLQAYHPIDNNFSALASQERELSGLENELDGVIAASAALSALAPNGRAMGRNSLGFGLGNYKNSFAIAAGYFYQLNQSSMINIAVTAGDNLDEIVSNVAFSYQF